MVVLHLPLGPVEVQVVLVLALLLVEADHLDHEEARVGHHHEVQVTHHPDNVRLAVVRVDSFY